MSGDEYRPRLHFSPRVNWCNDPNGLIWFEGEYHLFYQYNPYGAVWGHMSWGHAVSTDLLHWTELEVALAEDENGMIFSGSAVFDRENSSGLGVADRPALVAIYTRHAEGSPQRQSQCLAASIDRGRHWRKYAGNPVLDPGLAHFRDPKVFWHAPSARWVMIVALSDRNAVALYASADLRDWQSLSVFGPAGAGGALWECPDLFAVPISGTSVVRWVLKVDMFEGGVAGGASAQYFIGAFDGTRFVPDRAENGQEVWSWADFGKDFYAAVTWANLPSASVGPLWIGWMSAHVYAKDLPTGAWRGAMTLPRRLTLEQRADGLRLVQQPITIRGTQGGAEVRLDTAEVSDAQAILYRFLRKVTVLELRAVLSVVGELGGLVLRWSSGDELRVGYDGSRRMVFCDRSRSGLMTETAAFTGRRHAPAEVPVDLLMIVDACSVEIFADGGAVVITEVLFPRGDLRSLELFAQGGRAGASSLAMFMPD